MEGFIALILAGAIFRTPGTWALTRAISIADVVVAIFYAYTPLRPQMNGVWLGMLLLTAAVWSVNVLRLPRAARTDAEK